MKPDKRAIISRGSTAYARKRAVTACQVCRARRTKCDQKKPRCSFCEKTGADCVTEPNEQSSFDPASLAILARLESVEKKLDAIQATPSTPSQAASSIESAARQSSSDDDDDEPPPSLLPQNLDQLLQWPVFHPILPASPDQSGGGGFMGSQPRCRPASHHPVPSSMGFELDLSTSTRYLDTFFAHVHSKNPVLDEPSARRMVRRVCLDGPGWDPESCLALLLCANGAAAQTALITPVVPTSSNEEQQQQEHYSTSQILFHAAQKRLGTCLDAAGVLQAQCLFFAGVYLMTSLRPFDAWRLFQHGLAVCQAFSGGEDPPDPAQESIYWTCWKSEREVRWELRLPDFGEYYSSLVDAPQLFPSLPPSSPDGAETTLRAWYFYLSEISLWRLEMDARVEMARSIRETPWTTAGALLEQLAGIADCTAEQLTLWEQSLPLAVSIASPPAGGTTPEEHEDVLRFVLRGRTTYVHELISWPFIACIIAGRAMTERARSWAVRGIEAHVRRLVINRPGFYYRHHGTWLMIRSSARSLCLLLAVARTTAAQELLPDEWKEVALMTLDMFKFWKDEVEGMESLVEQLEQLLGLV
ncbi:hypothetical protein FE257_006537 [Aspergillus nanangensis]|uniref:Zn(2)-C6 fungal-type domain-containing protein n=1 Tax=Aspergillus nanangensis TaxID=2582783 RepID=A0AAD4CXQ3_ASPNN|nr:hypothetical protein FE257_006537 [Aspergillus nanangensis]